MLLKLSNLNSLTLGYLNQALNNSAQDEKPVTRPIVYVVQ